jgi:hypothetical protein
MSTTNKKKTRETLMHACHCLLGCEDLWASRKKKTRKMMMRALLSSWLQRLVNIVARRWQCTCVIVFLVVRTYEYSSKKKTKKMMMHESSSSWLWGLVSIEGRRRLGKWWCSLFSKLWGPMSTRRRRKLRRRQHTHHCFPSCEDLWAQQQEKLDHEDNDAHCEERAMSPKKT